ncbi:hypothetical protein [Streptomyces sp. NPDC051662]|uniref:hypothetical protein n=1 Tax=Streptomyces sp. NPDC051662 TaxID=3154750 RepID=UPI0034425A25
MLAIEIREDTASGYPESPKNKLHGASETPATVALAYATEAIGGPELRNPRNAILSREQRFLVPLIARGLTAAQMVTELTPKPKVDTVRGDCHELMVNLQALHQRTWSPAPESTSPDCGADDHMVALSHALGRHFLSHAVERLAGRAAYCGKPVTVGPHYPLQLVRQTLNYSLSHRGVQGFGSPTRVVREEPNVGDRNQFDHPPLRCDRRCQVRPVLDKPYGEICAASC